MMDWIDKRRKVERLLVSISRKAAWIVMLLIKPWNIGKDWDGGLCCHKYIWSLSPVSGRVPELEFLDRKVCPLLFIMMPFDHT